VSNSLLASLGAIRTTTLSLSNQIQNAAYTRYIQSPAIQLKIGDFNNNFRTETLMFSSVMTFAV